MKCPHELQPHQIQGLDCVKIFPVVQWLVKKAMERREEMAQYIRSDLRNLIAAVVLKCDSKIVVLLILCLCNVFRGLLHPASLFALKLTFSLACIVLIVPYS